MKSAGKRVYRGGNYKVPVATSVPPTAFYEIEGLAQTSGMTKSEVVRQLVLLGLAEYHRAGKLKAQSPIAPREQRSHYEELLGRDCDKYC